MTWASKLPLALLLTCAISTTLLSSPLPPQDTSARESPARADIEKIIKQSGATVTIASRSLDNSQELFIRADDPYDDPNTLRLPVMMELFAEAEVGELKLSDPLLIHDAVRVDPDAPAYHMDRKADPVLARSTGTTRTLRELAEDMIKRNSDFATNLLIERLTLARIRDRIQLLGANGMEIAAAFPNSKLNHTSTRAVLVLLWSLATEAVVSPDASKAMVGLIANSSRLPSSPTLPPPVPAPPLNATAMRDAVILYGARSIVFVIQVHGISDTSAGAELIGKITQALTASM
jgi:hypothetical protein